MIVLKSPPSLYNLITEMITLTHRGIYFHFQLKTRHHKPDYHADSGTESRLDDPRENGEINEAARQVAFADVLLVNKTDLVSEEEMEIVIQRIRELNKIAKIVKCKKCEVDLSTILDIGAYSLERAMEIDPEAFAVVSEPPPVEVEDQGHGGQGHGGQGHGGHGHGNQNDEHDMEGGENESHGHGHLDIKRHDTSITSVFIEEYGEVDLVKFNYWMGELLWERGKGGRTDDIYRMKGLMAIKGEANRYHFQGVATLFDSDEDLSRPPWKEGEKRICKLVLIGKSLDEPELRKGLQAVIEASKLSE